ncbi:MAG: hypothetical protein P4L55_00235 [Syntrophobacteraceae bacterium]|nr:hypothetical protein [Syntrophobacteraceae bacterium]
MGEAPETVSQLKIEGLAGGAAMAAVGTGNTALALAWRDPLPQRKLLTNTCTFNIGQLKALEDRPGRKFG